MSKGLQYEAHEIPNYRLPAGSSSVASDDEWVAPIMAELGPDGCVWVIDWYNFIVQHNPTPSGFETGKGGAYESNLRDKTKGRIYRIVCDAAPAAKKLDLSHTRPADLVTALTITVQELATAEWPMFPFIVSDSRI